MNRLATTPRPALSAGFVCLAFFVTALVLPTCAEAQFTAKPAVIMSKLSGKCVRVASGSTADGAALLQWTCDDSSGSRWNLVTQAGGTSPYVRVVASQSGKCLSVSSSSLADGTPVTQNTCTGIDSQLWTVQPAGQFYRLVAKQNGKCLHVNGGTDQGVPLVQWQCIGVQNEFWSFSEGFLGASQRSRIVNTTSNLCADVSGGYTGENGTVLQWFCKSSGMTNQQWALQRALDGYQLNVLHSNKCLAPYQGSNANNVIMVQVTCASANSQIWFVTASGSDYTLVNKNSNKCLDLGGDQVSPGVSLVQRSCNGTASQTWRVTSAFDAGSWSSRVNLPLVPVAAAALYNNKVLFWAAYDGFSYIYANDHGFTQTALFDVATNTPVKVQVSNTQHEMFCPGTAMLADGRVFVNGGTSSQKTSIYDPVTNSWSSGGNMNVPRGYNASTVVDSGKVFTIGGSWSGTLSQDKKGELWNPPSGGWAALNGIPSTPMTAPDPAGVYRGDNHAWLFNTGGGMVFHAGPSAQMNWFNTNGSGSFISAGNRGTDNYSMNGSAVMYDINRILKLGGAPAYDHADAVTKAYTININSGVVVTPTGSLTFARSFQNSVVLPDGRVFVAGGQSYPVPFSDGQSILSGEMWDSATGTFSIMAAASTPRAYHSVALLLPDARVLSGGGGLCGSCTNNHPDFEYYSPGYLFTPSGQAAVRPAIVSAPATAGYNTKITVKTSDTSVTRFVLIRLGTVTHSIDNDQRRIPLSIAAQSGTTYTVTTPASSGIGTPGFYMLFALNPAGVPSVAAIIRIG